MKTTKFNERGQALVVIALAAVVLFGFAGLAIDGSAKFSDRRHAQNAADTASLAAALTKVNELTKGTSDNSPTTGVQTTCPPPAGVLPSPVCSALLLAGLDRASSNGYNNNLSTNTVEVYSPPISGYYSTVSNKDQYIQVIITSHVPTTFMRVLGINQTDNVVQAVAFTNKGGPLFGGAAFISVDPSPNCGGGNGSGGGSVDVSGNSTIILNGGGIFVNSDETCGYSQTSCSVNMIINGGTILSAGSNIYMNQNGTQCNPSITPNSSQRQYMVPDEIYMPGEPSQCSQPAPAPTNLGSNNWLIHPGYYTDFPQASLVPNNKNIYLESGIYCINDDLSWSGASFKLLDGTRNGPGYSLHNGVTIYMKPGHDISLTINSPIYLNPSASGDYQGYVIIQAGNMNDIRTCKFTGGQYLTINGTVYAPYCNITINGDSNTTSNINAQFIGWDLKIDGNNVINVFYDPNTSAKNKRKIGLVK